MKKPPRCSLTPGKNSAQSLYTQLSLLGFRRSGDHVYRPHCARCNACIASRVRVQEFQASRTQQRISKRNLDLRIEQSDSILDDEAYNLYRYYIETRHADGDVSPEREQYGHFERRAGLRDLLSSLCGESTYMAVTVADKMLDGLAAIYSFFDPDQPRRSLGTEAILLQIREAQRMSLPFVYLGYWIDGCRRWPISPDLLRLSSL